MTSCGCGDVITLEGTGEKNSPEQFRFRTNLKTKKAPKHYPYFVDPSIVPRVKQYLEDNKDKVYVDIDDMVSELQRKYRDYAKKKRSAFKGLVEKAFSVVLKTYHVNNEDLNRDGEESDSSSVSGMDVDSDEDDLIVEPNTSNNQVMNLYMQQTLKKLAGGKQAAVPAEAKELIDISSDDEEQVPAKRPKHAGTANNTEPTETSPAGTSPAGTSPAGKSPADVRPLNNINGQATPQEVQVAHELVITTASPPVIPAAPVTQERYKRKRGPVDGNAPSTPSANSEISRRKRREVSVLRPCCSFKDVGGNTSVLQEVCKLLVHLRHPEIFKQIGVSPPRGFLLHGPPGCGKSLLANAIAGELGVPLLKVASPELVAGVSGESEERIRDLFDQAVSLAPCVLFLDEIDAITQNRNNAQREMERRIVAQLLTTLDELGEKEGGNQVLVIGATNRPDSLDPALRRAGRFDREVCMGIPDKEARAHILRVVCGRLALAPDVSSDAGIDELASLTPGFVGADLTALTREAAMVAINRIFAQLQKSAEDSSKSEQTTETLTQNEKSPDKLQGQEPQGKPVNAEIKENQKIDETEDGPEKEDKKDETSAQPNDEVVSSEGQQINETTKESQPLRDVQVVSENRENVCTGTENKTQTDANTEGSQDKVEGNTEEVEEINLPTPAEDNDEISVIKNDNSEKEAVTSVVACPPKSEEVEIVPQNDTTVTKAEAEQQSENPKTDDDVEVLEVDMVNGCDKSGETSVGIDSSTVKQKSEPKDLTLTQKLLPSSIWSPQLCQLMSWLTETPPLTSAQLNELTITMLDFHEALRHVQPSAKREGFATVPDVTWDDVGSLQNVRAELQLSVLAPVRYAKQFAQLGLNAPAGVLLCGPPGCGKTLLAKAVANEAGINFISVKGPELLNMYVGESERAVRQVFQRARNSAPCVIFFDELDALCPKRSDSGDNGVSSRVVNQLLTEMDGVEGRSAVFLVAASNRPDIIDPAVLRPGRLDKIVYVGLPNAEDRKDILRALTKNGSRPQLSSDVDLAVLASKPQFEGLSGADLAALVREAGVQALRDFIGSGGDPQIGPLSVSLRHFEAAAAKIRPSVTSKARKHYEKLQEMYSSTSTVLTSSPAPATVVASAATAAEQPTDKPEAMDTM